MMRRIICSLGVLFFLLMPTSLLAADFDKGMQVFEAEDYAVALAEWRTLAEQGYAEVQFNLGQMYVDGIGVPQDHAKAIKWYRLAATQGLAEAQYNLGVVYAEGRCVPQDYSKAAKWYRRAAEQGLADAQLYLGVMYYNGNGEEQDYVLAYMWGSIARAQGNENGDQPIAENGDLLIKAIEPHMSPDQISAAQTMIRKCRAQDYKDCDKL